MNRINWRIMASVCVCVAVAASSTLAFAQDSPERRRNPGENPASQLRLRHQQLEIEAQEAELNFQRQMRDLELEARRADIEREIGAQSGDNGAGGIVILVWLVLNILLATWVFQDIRIRNTGSGLWIVITLIAGIFGALVYALVRLGDSPTEDDLAKSTKARR